MPLARRHPVVNPGVRWYSSASPPSSWNSPAGGRSDRKLRWLDAVRNLAIPPPRRRRGKASSRSEHVRQQLGLMFSNSHIHAQESPNPVPSPNLAPPRFFLRFLHQHPDPLRSTEVLP